MSETDTGIMTPSTPLRQFVRLTKTVQDNSPITSLRAVAFYSAIGLPILYLPLLADGLKLAEVPLLVALLCANFAALLAGHGYGEK